jgi:acid phosphatase type 7
MRWRGRLRLPQMLAPRLGLFAGVVLAACTGPTDLSPVSHWPDFLRVTSKRDTVQVTAAGDIAGCNSNYKDEATAALIAKFPTALVLPLGDNVYTQDPTGSYRCFHASWGAFKSRMAPSLGNHEYLVPGAATYFDYFNGSGVDSGMAGHRRRGYYAFNYGGWRIYILNSEQLFAEQAAWIRKDAAMNPRQCQLAVWHRPYWTSGVKPGRSQGILQPMLDALVAIRAELLLSGHVHNYERFSPQSATGTASSVGVTQFVVGTGGGSLDESTFSPWPKPNSVVRIGNTHGMLWLKLYPPTATAPGRYAFAFHSIAGARLDSGGRSCRG